MELDIAPARKHGDARRDRYARQYLDHGDRLDPEGYHFCDTEFS